VDGRRPGKRERGSDGEDILEALGKNDGSSAEEEADPRTGGRSSPGLEPDGYSAKTGGAPITDG